MLFKTYLALNQGQKGVILLAMDLFWIILAFLGAQIVTYGGLPPTALLIASLWYLIILVPVGSLTMHLFRLHRTKLNAYGLQEFLQTTVLGMLIGASGYLLGKASSSFTGLPAQVFVQTGMLFIILSVLGRIALRAALLRVLRQNKSRKRVMIYGAGQTGQQLAAALVTDHEFEPVCFIDDNPILQKLSIGGLRVYSRTRLRERIHRDKIDRIVLAMPSERESVRRKILRLLRNTDCEVMTLPSFADIVVKGAQVNKPAPVDLTNLLGREAVEKDLPSVAAAYRGNRILITGAGGTIGSELCRQLLRCLPEKIILLDHSELALYTVLEELRKLAGPVDLRIELGSINNAEFVQDVISRNHVDVVFHAAAYKHVPIVEENLLEGVRNNVLGTRNVAEASLLTGVERFILVSSDKAVRPTSAMGFTKRMAELVVQDIATRSKETRFSMVRFGNVLGSSGSVVPLFEKQILAGGPVTVTDPEVTRFFMTPSEAGQLVLLAGSFSRGGDVFVLDMGQPVSIASMARKMIRSAGFTVRDHSNPTGDIEITFVGLRPGEKMHEELLIGSDMLTTPHPKILRAQEDYLSELEVANALSDLRRAVATRDDTLARTTLNHWVEKSPLPHPAPAATVS